MMKKPYRWISLALLLFLSLSTLSKAQAQEVAPISALTASATVNANLNMRSGPDTSYARLLTIPSGKSISVSGRNEAGNWLYASYQGQPGWIAGWFATLDGDLAALPVLGTDGKPLNSSSPASDNDAPADAAIPVYTTPSGSASVTLESNTRLRRAPSRTGVAFGLAPRGGTFDVIARNASNSWVKIEVNGRQGWVTIWNTRINGDINSAPVEGVQRSPGARTITAWEYHHLSFAQVDYVRMTPEWFEDQMRWLRDNGYYALSSQELVAYLHHGATVPPKSIVLTFDLGTDNRSEYEEIVRIMQVYGMKGIFFLVTDAVWEECVDDIHCWPAMQRWGQTGVVSYGSHSVNHPNYRYLSREQMLTDLRESKRIIESHLGPISGFATPFEATPPGFASVLSEAGYMYSFGGNTRVTDMGIHPYDGQWYDLPRLLPYSSYSWYPFITSRAEYEETFAELVYKWTNP